MMKHQTPIKPMKMVDLIEYNNQGWHLSDYSVWQMTKAYFKAVLACLLTLFLFPPLIILVYPMAGFMLASAISEHFKWWAQANTLNNIAKTKWRFAKWWIAEMPELIFRLAIVKF